VDAICGRKVQLLKRYVRDGSVASGMDENKMGLNLLEIMGCSFMSLQPKKRENPRNNFSVFFIQKNKELSFIFFIRSLPNVRFIDNNNHLLICEY